MRRQLAVAALIAGRGSASRFAPIAFAAITIVLGTLQCLAWNGAINADGVSYLDLASRYGAADVSTLSNGYWSPLYPLLIAAALGIAGVPAIEAGPSVLTAEIRTVLALNVLLLAAAGLLFARLIRALEASDRSTPPRAVRVCRWLAGLALWLWCGIRLIGAVAVTPDVLLAACLFLLTADLVDAGAREPSRARAVRIGLVLALAYWTKAVFFPLIFVGTLAYLALVPRVARRRQLPSLLSPLVVFVVPLVVIQSASQGRLSFGETGALNYRWYVTFAPRGEPRVEPPEATRARDPAIATRVRLAAAPGAVLYRGSVGGSFPYWTDASRFESSRPLMFSAAAQWRVVRAHARWYRVVAGKLALLSLGVLAAALVRQRPSMRILTAMLPALALLALHGLTHVEGRLVGAALATSLALFIHPGGAGRTRESVRALTMIECAFLVAVAAVAFSRAWDRVPREYPRQDSYLRSPGRELAERGVASGARIGMIGSPFGHYWLHQARLQLVVTVEPPRDSLAFGNAALMAIAAESCARGSPLAAIVWRAPHAPSGVTATPLAGGWHAWLPPDGCAPPRSGGVPYSALNASMGSTSSRDGSNERSALSSFTRLRPISAAARARAAANTSTAGRVSWSTS